MKKSPDHSAFDTLEDTSGYARPTELRDGSDISDDHIGNLERMREMLTRKRRYLAQDVMTYPAVFVGRAQDIAALQKLIDALDAALSDERSLQAGAGQRQP